LSTWKPAPELQENNTSGNAARTIKKYLRIITTILL
jgi:hypothetical protein